MQQMFKNMDNNTIKSMMAQQGMPITDDQINMVKNMPPEMFNNMKSMMNQPGFTPPPRTQPINGFKQEETQPVERPQPQMPNPGGMDFKSMMDMISKNPDLMKMISPEMAKMFGGKNGEMPPQFETIMYLLSLPHRIKSFFTSFRGISITVLVIVLVYSYFKS